jgi:hypothetical protein
MIAKCTRKECGIYGVVTRRFLALSPFYVHLERFEVSIMISRFAIPSETPRHGPKLAAWESVRATGYSKRRGIFKHNA